MKRRNFLALSAASAAAPGSFAFQAEKSKLKITGVRLVQTRPKRPLPEYKPAATAWSTNGVEVASPMSIYPQYKATRSLFLPDSGKVPTFTVEVTTNKGLKGYGSGGPGGGPIVEEHLSKLIVGKDPFDVERNWDIMWRSTISYGQTGVTMNAISGVDIALWDLVGKALNMPVYKVIGGETKERIPSYCTGNDLEQHVEVGFKRVKLAIPKGPADGRDGMKVNEALVKHARELLGPEGDIMLDCWMSWTERYAIEMAEMLAPYRIFWMEECLPPYDYAGFGRLREQIKSTRIVTGEHEYGRYGFRNLLEHRSAEIWQPDIHWCGGLTELRHVANLAAAYDIPVMPHVGGVQDCVHFIMATTNAPWAELFMPSPGGPKEVYRRWEEDNQITRGPEGIYTRPSEEPGFGWDFEVAS